MHGHDFSPRRDEAEGEKKPPMAVEVLAWGLWLLSAGIQSVDQKGTSSKLRVWCQAITPLAIHWPPLNQQRQCLSGSRLGEVIDMEDKSSPIGGVRMACRYQALATVDFDRESSAAVSRWVRPLALHA